MSGVTGDDPRFMAATSDKGVAAALDARERREREINRDGFRSHGLREGEVLQGLDGRVWRVLGPATLPASDALVRVENVATGALEHRYARTVALWAPTELHLASPAERHRTQADGPTQGRARGGGPPPLPGPSPKPFPQSGPPCRAGRTTTTEV